MDKSVHKKKYFGVKSLFSIAKKVIIHISPKNQNLLAEAYLGMHLYIYHILTSHIREQKKHKHILHSYTVNLHSLHLYVYACVYFCWFLIILYTNSSRNRSTEEKICSKHHPSIIIQSCQV